MDKEIKTVLHHNQCKEYYEAKERGDVYAMHIWFIPPFYKSLEMIKSEMRFNKIVATYEAEKKRIEETPSDILRLELEMRFKVKEPIKRWPTLLERIFGAT